MKQNKKGLGRGLSALIPTEDMEFLSQVARGDFAVDLSMIAPPRSLPPSNSPGEGIPATKAIPPAAPTPVAAPKPNKKRRPTTNNQFDISQGSADDNKTLSASVAESASQSEEAAFQDVRVAAKPAPDVAARLSSDAVDRENGVVWLAPDVIVANPFQPRRHFDAEELRNLASSIREHGILQPIIVRPVSDSLHDDSQPQRFQLVAGERRWRAAQTAALELIPAIVRAVDDQQALELAVIENVQRHDISPLDAALAYKRLASEFHLSQERIAVRVGKSRSAVANTLRLLDLPEEVQKAINDGLLSEGHGRAILLADAEGTRRAAFRRILRDKLSVREAEDLARRFNQDAESEDKVGQAKDSTIPAQSSQDTNLLDLCEELQRLLGTRLSIKHRSRGGQLIIQYSSSEEFERIIHLLRTAGASA